MSKRMLRFVNRSKQLPPKRSSSDRISDFKEIYEGFQVASAEMQAERCSQCGIPFCASGCPLSNDIPDWLYLVANNRLEEAYERSSATNSFPEICGRICPQDRLCEGSCVIQKGFGSVTIGAVERFITENAFKNGWVTPKLPVNERSETVGIIGAGPAGLACAEMLRRYGVQVVVYDRNPEPGGLLSYGIPGFKIEKDIVRRRWQILQEQGVLFKCSVEVGKDISFHELRKKHDALYIATGVYKPRNLDIEGSDLKNIIFALDYLISVHAPQGKESSKSKPSVKGKKVIVIGGGDTAMDCARTAVREGAENVTVVYRRDRNNMPGSKQEVKNAEEEGVFFDWLLSPVQFVGKDKVEGVKLKRMALGNKTKDGRQDIIQTDEDVFISADVVICALGFLPEKISKLWGEDELEITSYDTIKTNIVKNSLHATSLPGVFAGGDIVRGASLVVWAIRDGREAAVGIKQYLFHKK